MKFSRLLSTVAVTAIAVSTLSGCTTISTLVQAYGSHDSATPKPTSTASATGTVELGLGECFDRDALVDADAATKPQVKCSELHDIQVFASFPVEGKEYPSTETMMNIATTTCTAEFTKFVGLEFSISSLDFEYFYPTESSWSAGDREINCAIFDPAGPVEGSLRNADR